MGDDHTLSAGVIVVRRLDGEPRYLLLRAYSYWDFPKGEPAPGEEPLATALREVEEETSLADLELRWGEECHETAPYGRSKIARYYVAESPRQEVHLPVSPELGRPEHHEHRWLPYEEARKLLLPRVAEALAWAHRRVSGRRGGDRSG